MLTVYILRLMKTKKGTDILNYYDKLVDDLDAYENKLLTKWKNEIPVQCNRYLQQSLLIRETKENRLLLNFHHEVIISFAQPIWLGNIILYINDNIICLNYS